MSHVCNRCRRFLAFAMLAGVLTTLLSFAEVRAQGVQQKNMDRMPGMGGTKLSVIKVFETASSANKGGSGSSV